MSQPTPKPFPLKNQPELASAELGTETRKYFHLYAKGLETIFERRVVLLGQDGGWAQHHNLLVVLRCFEGSAQRHLGLAKANVATDLTVHGAWGLHIGLDISNGG